MALLQEAPSIGKEEARRLILHGTIEKPQLMWHPEIEIAGSVDTIPLDLLPAAIRNEGPYTIEAIRNKDKRKPVQKLTTNLVLIKFNSDSDPAEIARKVNRGMDRSGQYQNIVKRAIEWRERLQRGDTADQWNVSDLGTPPTPVGFDVTPEVMDVFNRMATAFYADELRQEPFTQEVAKGVKAQLVLQEEAIVAQAEQIIFEYRQSLSPSEVDVTYTEIKEKTAKSNDKTTASTPAEQKQATDYEKDSEEEALEDIAKKMYVHDEFEDEPQIAANIFFEKLMQQPPAKRENNVTPVLPDKPSPDATTKYIPIEELLKRNF